MKLIPRMDGIDADDAAEHVADPSDGNISFPFGPAKNCNMSSPGSSKQPEASEPTKKGTNPKKMFSKSVKKYSSRNIPKNIRNSVSSICKLPSKWKKLFLKTGSAAIARSTWKKYGSAFNAYEKFCSEEKILNPWPLVENTLICFILWCHKFKKLKACSIRGYLSGLRTISRIMGFERRPAKKELEKFLIRGISLTNKSAGRRPSDPMLFEVVQEIRKVLDKKSWKTSSKNTIWACVCIGYFGAFRASELLVKSSNSFDNSSDLVWNDISFNGKRSVSFKIRNPKTGGGKTEIVELFRFPDKKFCPVRALRLLKKQSKNCSFFNATTPVFRFGSGKVLNISTFSKLLKQILAKSKFAKWNISAKSMRAGLPSDLEKFPDLIEDGHIKAWGRWKSTAYQRYMRNKNPPRKWIFEKICQAILPLCS